MSPRALVPCLPLVLALSLVACGGKDVPPVFPEVTVNEPDPAVGITLRGRVLWEGEIPDRPRLAVGHAFCADRGGDFRSRDVLVDEGGLANVVVWVREGLEAWTFDHVRKEAVLDQIDCRFEPHVLLVQQHQPVLFRNSDATAHNVNTRGSKTGQGFVKMTPTTGSTARAQFANAEFNIPVLCDLHPWMRAWVHVMPHPYHDRSGRDGRFELPRRLPPGEYVIEALHPKLGTRSQTLTVAEGDDPELEITFRFP